MSGATSPPLVAFGFCLFLSLASAASAADYNYTIRGTNVSGSQIVFAVSVDGGANFNYSGSCYAYPATPRHYSLGVSTTQNVKWRWQTPGGVVQDSGDAVPPGANGIDLHTWNGTPTPQYYWCDYSFNITNNTTSAMDLGFTLDGTPVSFDVSYLVPGSSGLLMQYYTLRPTEILRYNYRVKKNAQGDPCPVARINDLTNGRSWSHNGTPGSGQTEPTTGPTGGGTDPGPGLGDPNGPNGSGTSTNSAGGGGATSGDINRLGNSLLQALGSLQGELRKKAEENTLQATTNLLGQVNRSTLGVSNAVASLNGTLLGQSNLLGQVTNLLSGATGQLANIYGALTNRSGGTNAMPGTGTNYGQALAAGNQAADGWISGLTTAESSYGEAPTVDAATAPADFFKMRFCGYDLDFDPATRWPGLQTAVYGITSFLLLLAFCQWAGGKIFELSTVYAQAQTGGVPDLAFMGFNVHGPIVTAIVAVIFIALWVTAGTYLTSLFLAQSGLLPTAGAGFSSKITNGNQAALYLLTSFFPVSLALNLAFARMALQVGLAKVVTIAASASRFLTGQ